MSWYSRLLNQTATYWSPEGFTDAYASVSFGTPTTISVRWEDRIEKYLGPTGQDEVSAAIAWSDQDVEVGGFLYLGTSTEADPRDQAGAFIIRRFDKVWDVRGKLVERRIILTTIRSVNMTVGG